MGGGRVVVVEEVAPTVSWTRSFAVNQQGAVRSFLPDHRPGSDGGGGSEVVRRVCHDIVGGVRRQGTNLIFGTSVESGRHSEVTLSKRMQGEESSTNRTGGSSMTSVR